MSKLTSLSKHRCIIAGVLLFLLLFYMSSWPTTSSATAQQAPAGPLAFSSSGTINFQGQLTDLAGVPLNGSYNLRFAIYDASSGGNKKWPSSASEQHASVVMNNGIFSVQLGSISEAISAAVFNGGGDRYLQVWVCTTAGAGCATYDNMGRLPISSAAYAQTLGLPALLEKNDAATLIWVRNSGIGSAIYGESVGTSSDGVIGYVSSTSGINHGIYGRSASTDGRGVFGYTTNTTGTTYGVYGQSDSIYGRGVYGLATATSGGTYGIEGISYSTAGRGVFGFVVATNGQTFGVAGESASTNGQGVHGVATASTGPTYGVFGVSTSEAGIGVYGFAPKGFGYTYGVYGQSDSTDGRGVYGESTASSGNNRGVEGRSASTDGRGVYGEATTTIGDNIGVEGRSASPSGRGVFGWASATSGGNIGVYGRSDSYNGFGLFGIATASSGPTYGVYGMSYSATGYGGYFAGYGADVLYVKNEGSGRAIQAYAPNDTAIWGITVSGLAGVDGRSGSTTGRGVYGRATSTTGTNYGVYGRTDSPTGYAGYFLGNLHTTGNFTAVGSKAFIIDHPLDPANQYLYHYSLEGPQPFNLYRGTVTLDGNGSALVQLPAYFEAINTDFSYLLTPIGVAMPNLHVAQKMLGNAFHVAGGEPGMEVAWLVTALRNDPWMRDQGFLTETAKPAEEIGSYLYPQGYGQPAELGRDYLAQTD